MLSMEDEAGGDAKVLAWSGPYLNRTQSPK
jgi:hypothetical protein